VGRCWLTPSAEHKGYAVTTDPFLVWPAAEVSVGPPKVTAQRSQVVVCVCGGGGGALRSLVPAGPPAAEPRGLLINRREAPLRKRVWFMRHVLVYVKRSSAPLVPVMKCRLKCSKSKDPTSPPAAASFSLIHMELRCNRRSCAFSLQKRPGLALCNSVTNWISGNVSFLFWYHTGSVCSCYSKGWIPRRAEPRAHSLESTSGV
jgi:hypothetical protein